MKRPLAALLLVPAGVLALAVPAGASTRTTWTHQTFRCQGGRYATVTYKWQGGVAVETWVDNRCSRQWVNVTWCEVGGDSPKCGQADVAPATKTHFAYGNAEENAGLESSPSCADQGGSPCEA